MNRLFDKSIVLACCIAAATGLAVDARLVAAFCLSVIATSLVEVAQEERTRRASETASYAYIIAAVFMPPFVPLAPLALYDIVRRVRGERVWAALGIGSVFTFALVADLRADALAAQTLLLAAILSVAATLLSLRTAQLEREQQRMRRTRDELQERTLALEARHRDLADRQDYEVELAILAERARIAREIHDNVGHQLTRASLQAEALRVTHADEPGVAADFADVKRTVDEALQLVRASVHALNDTAVDLSVQLERIVEGARSNGGPQIELEVLTEHAPANVTNCFAAVLREALSNTMRHACAQTVTVRCMEHPSFYQLIVTDDGSGGAQASARGYLIKTDVAAIPPALDQVMDGKRVLEGKAIEDIDFDGTGVGADTHHRPAAFASLTDREFEVAELIARGLDNKEIAATAYMGEGTVRNHISSILAKMGLRNRTQIAIAYLRG